MLRFNVTLIDSPDSIVFLEILLVISTLGVTFSSAVVTGAVSVSEEAVSDSGLSSISELATGTSPAPRVTVFSSKSTTFLSLLMM